MSEEQLKDKEQEVKEESAKAQDAEAEKAEEAAEAGAEKAEGAPEADAAKAEAKAEEPKAEDAKKQEDLQMQYMRLAADFQNFRKRTEKERADIYAFACEGFASDLLNVMDNFERAMAVESEDAALKEGVGMVYRQLKEALEKRGVTAIERLGEKFDPSLENAVLQGTAEEGEPGTVCAVLQKGYKMGDFVLRHAMVKVVAE